MSVESVFGWFVSRYYYVVNISGEVKIYINIYNIDLNQHNRLVETLNFIDTIRSKSIGGQKKKEWKRVGTHAISSIYASERERGKKTTPC